MKRGQINTIASLITEDPDIHEMGPEGGIHPGRDNKQSFERSQMVMHGPGSGGFEVRKIDQVSGRSSHWLQFFGMTPQTAEQYLPLYFVFKDDQPYIVGSPKNENQWYNTDDMQLKKASSELLSALADAGVPEEMMPGSPSQESSPQRPPQGEGDFSGPMIAFDAEDESGDESDPGMGGGMDIGDYDDPENDPPENSENDSDDSDKEE